MCGIAGIITFTPNIRFSPEAETRKMLQILAHRGPDGQGVEVLSLPNSATQIVLGHRRLSILDLSEAGHQPMYSPDKSLCITFNGEIYNYIELREELKQLGHHFRTGTDTEVLIAAYTEWKEACLTRLNGMFAFVIADLQRGEIFAARDRTGVKPFYFTQVAHHFLAFASEIKAFCDTAFYRPEVHHEAVFDYFVLGKMDHESRGLFKSIQELMPSHYARWTRQADGNWVFQTQRYYTPHIQHNWESFSESKFQNHVVQTKSLLQNAVNLRLRSDVSVGSCLSGGLDSSSIVCLINQTLQANPLTQVGEYQQVFTSCYNDSRFDESAWAKLVADQTGATWQRTFPDYEGFHRDFESMIYTQDLPTLSPSTYAQFCVMKLVGESGVKVVLDGQGGDELFSGYLPHSYRFWQDLVRHFALLRVAKELKLSGGAWSGLKSWTKYYLKNDLLRYLPKTWQAQLFNKNYQELSFVNPDIINAYLERYLLAEEERQARKGLNEFLAYEFFNGPLKHLLRCEDRNSMRFSVESRTPFADDSELMEAIFQIPAIYKVRNGERKILLREAMRGILPEAIRQRQDKMGFAAPTNDWLRQFNVEAKDYFQRDAGEIFNLKNLNQHYDSFFNPQSDTENYRIYKFTAFAVWKSVFFSTQKQ